ncbi:MAG: WhiB family transcriptional regulator [Intrasporangium sp.]|uniref:WhiB family transcriptional regulator n=1 Tax=Intrasporangium sp. TaxID=1925024 RepID=UPI0026488CD1|nr:WhiB family transcriptional regulator [Intrasporangium sp.]MDN5797464.1 WhiB family transcriptional regulator [Intrasporangium sp.]
MEWVPDRERTIVPDVMAALCRRCPGRQECLLWALTGDEQGYWAGTTRADRLRMVSLEQTIVETADWLQDLARSEATAGAIHPVGDGSYFWYRRRGCRCTECKQANAAARAHERAVARQKAGVAA